MQGWAVFLVASAYISILFAVAWYGDQRAVSYHWLSRTGVVYALTLAVYNTTWSFYGSIGRAATNGLVMLSIYVGPVAVLTFGRPILHKALAVAKQQNATSIADFLAARYGKSGFVAMLMTLMSLAGVLPYIALQLKAVGASYDLLTGSATDRVSTWPWNDTAFGTAIAMAAFVILFGVRHLRASEHHRGLMLAVAFESIAKLACLLAVAGFAVFGLFAGPADLLHQSAKSGGLEVVTRLNLLTPAWISNTLISAVAFVCLPQAFHVAVVENRNPRHLRAAAWVFPTYLAVLSALIIPVALAGPLVLGSGADPDTYMIALPVASRSAIVSLLAFIGGLSAATGMVIVAVVSLSTMLSNDVVAPLLLRRGRTARGMPDPAFPATLLQVRRVAVVVVLALAYVMGRLLDQRYPLTQIGLTSFVAVAQFGPAFLGALYWRRATQPGAVFGLACGFAVWAYTLLLPALAQYAPLGLDGLLAHGPWGAALLRPTSLFGTGQLDPISHSTLWSLAANVLAFVLVSAASRPSAIERLQAAAFAFGAGASQASPTAWRAVLRLSDLRDLAEHLAGQGRGAAAFDAYVEGRRRGIGRSLDAADPASAGLADADAARFTETLIAGVVGAPSARIVMAASLESHLLTRREATAMLDTASQVLRFRHSVLQATLENIRQGILVLDPDFLVAAWNRHLVELLDLPAGLLRIGTPLTELIAFNQARGEYGADDLRALIVNRDVRAQAWPYTYERRRPSGTMLEVSFNRSPDGTLVATYTDMTDRDRAASALREANERLEERVRNRTLALERATHAAEQANASKTRFLAAASHDLMQPLNAARLFASTLRDEVAWLPPPGRAARLAGNVLAALDSTGQLLSALTEASMLDAGGVQPVLEDVPASVILKQLALEFSVLAAQHGAQLTVVASSQVIRTDPRLLQRILQNLLANAIRHAPFARVLVGARRRGGTMEFQVWDTGPGIPDSKHAEIFQEFSRLLPESGTGAAGCGAGSAGEGGGLGLGLAIVDRLSRTLGHPVGLCSRVGQGSRFSVSVPRASMPATSGAVTPSLLGVSLAGLLVLIIDNDPAACAGMVALLEGWSCRTLAAAGTGDALELLNGAVPDALLMDYHLNACPDEDRVGSSGLDVLDGLRHQWGRAVPALLITADPDLTRHRRPAAHCGVLDKPAAPAALRRFLSGVALRSRPPLVQECTIP